MKSLDPMPMVAAVLSFDFDGTLHTPDEVPPVPVEFFDVIRQLREEHAIVWGINTGRSLEQITEGFIESNFPFLPDWLVAREREIYFPAAGGRWQGHDEWNHACDKQIHALFKESRKLLDAVRRMIEEYTGARWMAFEGEPAGIIAHTEEEMEWIAGKIEIMLAEEPRLGWQRNSIYLRFGHRDFQKGSCLSEVARRYALGAPRCFAIGDSHNDLEMLAPEHALMAACPGNAVEAVRQHVADRGGYVAEAAHGAGVIESLRHFFKSVS
jgi:HAD superfamily hydrolase (TIGR01484 family)